MTSIAIRQLHNLIAIGILSTNLAACSIYESRGREQFENRAPGNIRIASVPSITTYSSLNADTDLVVDEDFSSCWIQNKDEVIWSTPPGRRLETRDINDKKMAVCLETDQHE